MLFQHLADDAGATPLILLLRHRQSTGDDGAVGLGILGQLDGVGGAEAAFRRHHRHQPAGAVLQDGGGLGIARAGVDVEGAVVLDEAVLLGRGRR